MMDAHAVAADLSARFRLNKRTRGWAGDCPACHYPRAFWIRVGKESMPVLSCFNGCTQDVLADIARQALGNAWTPVPPPDAIDVKQARAAKQEAARRLWSGSMPCEGTPAALYLAGRGIGQASASASLRFRVDTGHPEGGRLPAMVALVQDAAGHPVACHRTYLSRDGRKASADPQKASLGPVWGGAIRLDPAGPELAVGEGIETAASAGLLLGLPAWAAINAGNLASGLLLPLDVRSVVIAADNDAKGLGQSAAKTAAKRWKKGGRTVRIVIPDVLGQDFNDVLQNLARRATGLAHG